MRQRWTDSLQYTLGTIRFWPAWWHLQGRERVWGWGKERAPADIFSTLLSANIAGQH